MVEEKVMTMTPGQTQDAEIRFEWVNPQAPGGESMRRVCEAAIR